MPSGVDVSEFQAVTPGGFAYAHVRTINENGREDFRWRQHHADYRGIPRGAYGIIRPWNIDPGEWTRRFVGTLSAGWEIVPTVDIELGDPGQNVAYAATVCAVLRAAGYRVIMGYYSAGSAYRSLCQHLFDRHWLAAWGSRFPAGAHEHQYQGSPLDLDFCPDLAVISMGAVGPGPTPEPIEETGGLPEMFEVESGGNFYVIGGPAGVSTVTGATYMKLAASKMPHAEQVNGVEVVRWSRDVVYQETAKQIAG